MLKLGPTKWSTVVTSSRTKKFPINGPTILTILRIILVGPVIAGIFMEGLPAKIIALVCFIIGSITDNIDGRWARRDKLVTDFGAFLDPLADKMLTNLTFLAFVILGQMPLWMFMVILVRDYAVDGLRMIAARKNVTISASIFGKVKTTVQMITLISMLLNLIVMWEPLAVINIILLYVVMFLTLYSGIDYLIKGRKLMV
ncbi:CDP-diacylglycerol--glycerol-3-phosphate 3-phosphatidyltransferase [Candidatus Saccharibacteria bacterium]|nr:CDP-diacylglycerol--glycerol-3-phosphate 3-phosphatidyltransferase [Candidatus Saccharibacteria bacterium]